LAKTTVVLGLVMSLIGGVAPRLVKADGNIVATLKGEANVAVSFEKAKAGPRAAAKTCTKAAVKKGDKTMKPITTINDGVGKVSSLPGE
jgi:hypothetical protein